MIQKYLLGEFNELMSYNFKRKRNDAKWLLLEVLIQQSIFALCKARGACELTHVLLIHTSNYRIFQVQEKRVRNRQIR